MNNPIHMQVAEIFVHYYYRKWVEKREDLKVLYRQSSMMIFNDYAAENPLLVHENPKFPQIGSHNIRTVDVQSTAESGIIVFVTGTLRLTNNHELGFNQVFHLAKEVANYYVSDEYLLIHDISSS